MSATSPGAAKRRNPKVAGELAADLRERGLDLTELQGRINAISQREGLEPMTDEYLEEIESVRAAVSDIFEAVTRTRLRGVVQGVNERWTYARIGKATGLTRGRIAQIAPPRPR
jgi:hypothetical protein